MQNKDLHGSKYVERIRDDTQRYVKGLLTDIEELRFALARVENEALILRDELSSAKNELMRHRDLELELEEVLSRVRNETEQYQARYAEVELHNTNLANLYVASYQLQGTLDRSAILAAMQEIIINLIGSERFGICELDEHGDPAIVASVGLDRQRQDLGHEAVARTIATGELYVSEFNIARRPNDPLVCIPLKLDGRVIGVIVILALLSHKTRLEPVDHELFDLLGTHAATALYCTALHERIAGKEAGAA